MVGKTQGSYAATYSYRFGDKLKAATSSFPGETASVGYNYDGLGRRRLEQRDNTTATWFRWSGLEECGEYAGTVGSWTIGALQTGYVPGLATFAGSNPATAEWRYHLTDHLGSVRQLSGQNKAALARYDYVPYGELMRNAGLPLTVGYTGHLWDSAIGQYYAPFRYYNPQTARWNMHDPLGMVDGPNMYAYVVGNPVNYFDIYGGSILGDSIDYLADLGDCLDGKRVIIKQRRKGRHFASEFPSWWGLPFIPLPKLPKNLGRFSILKPYTRIMGSRYTSIPSILRASIPYSKFPGLSSTRYWLRIASKASPWITIADGVISWARIGQCATKI